MHTHAHQQLGVAFCGPVDCVALWHANLCTRMINGSTLRGEDIRSERWMRHPSMGRPKARQGPKPCIRSTVCDDCGRGDEAVVERIHWGASPWGLHGSNGVPRRSAIISGMPLVPLIRQGTHPSSA